MRKKRRWGLLAELVLPGQRIVLACICAPEKGKIETRCEMGEAAEVSSRKGPMSRTGRQSLA